MSKEIAEDYASSLADLTVNSKPLINMLTILAEENIEHAGAIVETVEKHLEKVQPDIKLPVLYLVDSIIKNVGGAYMQKFSQSIVNMFTRTFKQVDEKTRSQMFKLRETWHDVFPGTKLYQLDVKVNLIDPAWPIQAQPQQSNIHVNPNFLKKTVATTSAVTPVLSEEERAIIAKKEQELLMLQKKKIEMELEQTKKQLELAEKNAKKVSPLVPPVVAVAPVPPAGPVEAPAPVRQRLGPPVPKAASGRIAPVSGALVSARRDPRLARHAPPTINNKTPVIPQIAPTIVPIAPNVFDIKPLDRVIKHKNVITIDVRPDAVEPRPPQRDPRVRDPRLERRDPRREKHTREERRKIEEERRKTEENDRIIQRKAEEERRKNIEYRDKLEFKGRNLDTDKEKPNNNITDFIDKITMSDSKKINKLPPIPKINRDDGTKDVPAPIKRRKEIREKKKKREDIEKESDKESLNASPQKRAKNKEIRKRKDGVKALRVEPEPEVPKEPVVEFKELKNYKKDRYMRRNKEKSESPENSREPEAKLIASPVKESSNVPDVVMENKDVDLRVLPVVETKPALIGQKRSSTETIEGKAKKTKLDKFDILFGNEDVDLRQLPQVEEVVAPPPPIITDSPKKKSDDDKMVISPPQNSPKQKDWNEVKEKDVEEIKKVPSKLDLVRAKLAEATKGKDRLGRPLLFTKSPSIEKERRRTISDKTEDTENKVDSGEEFDAEDHKKSISIIMSQAKEQFNDGQLDKNQYNTLMYQVLQLNEKLKLKEAKQRESLEISKRKLKAHIHEENNKVPSPKSSPSERNNYGDIDERVTPSVFLDTPPDSQKYLQDSDMRVNSMPLDGVDGPMPHGLLPPPMMPMFGPYNPMWRGQPRGRMEEYGPRRFRGPVPPFLRGKFDKRALRLPFDPRLPIPPLPTPKIGMCQGECPLRPYERVETPPPLGVPGVILPPTDYNVLEYIDQDPVKTIQIDGVPREIRFYGDTAVIMLDWDDPREIKFLPGCRRVTFDNKDSVVLSFNEGYKQVEIDDQMFDIKFGAPTRELYINGRWHECFFGGQPLGVIIDGKPRLVHLEGPLPQVDIGKSKRTDLVAGKINLIVNATHMCPVYLDAKVQKFHVNGQFFTIRFVDSLKTVLINEQPFQVEFGDLPRPIFIGNEKYFIRFSALPKNIKPGYISIANMEGSGNVTILMPPVTKVDEVKDEVEKMETDEDQIRPNKTPSPDINNENQGLDVLASVMPSSTAPASASEYSVAEPLFLKTDKIPGLETPSEEKPPNPILPIQNINVNDLFEKLVAIGIVKLPTEAKEEKPQPKVEEKPKPREDKNLIHTVDLLKPETLRGKQPGIVAKLYGGMQCSGCGARFPPEHTVRYSQHLDWHFRQNRRERDSARRAHSRHWHYDLSDWVQYEEIEDLEEREKSWFETGGAEGEVEGGSVEVAEEAPSVAAGLPHEEACALCGDKFHQFYNEDKEEWHLRNSVRHEDKNYHPLCFDDYKASLTKEEPVVLTPDEVKPVEIMEEAIEIKDVEEEEEEDNSDNESVVEVVDPEPTELSEPVEIEEGEEDDVVLKTEPVEQVVVEDECDTDEETTTIRAERDKQAAIDFANVKIKQEPIDPDDEPIVTAEEETITPNVDTTHTTVLSSIDGNVQFNVSPAPAPTLPIGGIRINISKSIPSFITNHEEKMFDDISADDEPLPPGEEPELEYKLKPALEGVQFSRQPPCNKGTELSGLCSIM